MIRNIGIVLFCLFFIFFGSWREKKDNLFAVVAVVVVELKTAASLWCFLLRFVWKWEEKKWKKKDFFYFLPFFLKENIWQRRCLTGWFFFFAVVADGGGETRCDDRQLGRNRHRHWSTWYRCALLGFTGFYWVLLSLIGLWLCLTWFYWVSAGFYLVSMGYTGLNWLTTGFYWVLMGYSGF